MPVGYADDLAAACLSKIKMDRAMDVVYAYGRTWRYNFNPKKSGILVFGETQREQEINPDFFVRPGKGSREDSI